MARPMVLKKFKVCKYRSVDDSGWIDVDDVGSLIGINESGKSNLLMPLWKLNPAKGGEIDLVSDLPRDLFNTLRDADTKPEFIVAQFELSAKLRQTLSTMTGYPEEQLKVVSISRDYDDNLYTNFILANPKRELDAGTVRDVLIALKNDLLKMDPSVKAEDGIKMAMLKAADSALADLESLSVVDGPRLTKIQAAFKGVDLEGVGQRSLIGPRFGQAIDVLGDLIKAVSIAHPNDNEKAIELVEKNIPKFVYYSNYGNLDSEIYLPHVIENMSRENVGTKEEAKARTLKVLFDFVRLKPQEILDLGKDAPPGSSPEVIEAIAAKKKERDILLQSASTALTKAFREWWRQGDYKFRLAADGSNFRIWVSDDKRPDDIELENRSTGLQWFLSFFLVFLVEASDSHEGAILLLDEPGLTLHPLAQRDLSIFFDNLAKDNQIIFSTHSPFMVEADKLDRVRAVYVDKKGKTAVTADLRAAAPGSVQSKSIYAAHAALGLTVSDVILQGCQPVIVEGQSDQFYFTMLKNFLISRGDLLPVNDLVFMSGGGTKAIRAVASILSCKDNQLPYVIVDSDRNGEELVKTLGNQMYMGQRNRIIALGKFRDVTGTEVEDLLPTKLIAEAFSRDYRGREIEFSDAVDANQAIVPQMEKFAKDNELTLKDGWKVELARAVLRKASANPPLLESDAKLVEIWKRIFSVIVGDPASVEVATGQTDAVQTVMQ